MRLAPNIARGTSDAMLYWMRVVRERREIDAAAAPLKVKTGRDKNAAIFPDGSWVAWRSDTGEMTDFGERLKA